MSGGMDERHGLYGRSPGKRNAADTRVLQNAVRTTMTWQHLKRARDTYAAELAPEAAGMWGLDIYVVPTMVTRRLTLWGSLVELWRTGTWKRYVEVENQARPPAGTFWRVGRSLFCRAEDYQALKYAARNLP